MHQSYFRQVIFGILLSFLSASFLFPGRIEATQRAGLAQDLFSVSFPSESDGWACGRWGTILHTKDGGKTWVRQNSTTDYTLSSVFFLNSLTGFAAGDGGTILRTTDGGKLWVKQDSPVPGFLMGMYFSDPQHGWIVTERTIILHTENGGGNWQIQFSDGDFILKNISFCDPRNGWAVGEYGYIYHTNNGGKTWHQQAGEFGFSEKTGDIIGGDILFDVLAISPEEAWVVGIGGYVGKTVDGGATWRRVASGVLNTPLFGILSDRKGNIIIGGDALLRVKSGDGEEFKAATIEPPIPYGWIYRFARRGKADLVAVGKSGLIYFSEKNGSMWRLGENK